MAEIYKTRPIFFPPTLIRGPTTGPWNLNGRSATTIPVGAAGVALPKNTKALVIQTNVAVNVGPVFLRFFDSTTVPVHLDFNYTNALPIQGLITTTPLHATSDAYVLEFGDASQRTGLDCPWFNYQGGALATAAFYVAIGVVVSNTVASTTNVQIIGNE